MAKPAGKPSAKPADVDKKAKLARAEKVDVAKGAEQADESKSSSRLGWLVGWVLLPGTVLFAIFAAGALLGAHYSESWFTRLILWFVGLF